MEIKASLSKPYSAGSKLEFIVEYNHNKGYEIREAETALEAWGLTKAEIEEQEKERIQSLTCTKRVLALILKEYGISYSTLKGLIASNEDAQLEWDLCVELERSNPLLDIIGAQLNLTPAQIDDIFKLANGEEV